MNPAESLLVPTGAGAIPAGDRPSLLDIEAMEQEIAALQPGGYDRTDRVWLRREALRQLRTGGRK